MWDILIDNFATVVLILIAILFCGAEVIKAYHVWKDEHDKRATKKRAEQEHNEDLTNTLNKILTRLDSVDSRLDGMDLRMESAETRLQRLTESDMHDIKAWIVVQYHKYFVEQGWIDNYSAETIERRYEDYTQEGGNSYISVLIDRLRTLPMDPPNNHNSANSSSTNSTADPDENNK